VGSRVGYRLPAVSEVYYAAYADQRLCNRYVVAETACWFMTAHVFAARAVTFNRIQPNQWIDSINSCPCLIVHKMQSCSEQIIYIIEDTVRPWTTRLLKKSSSPWLDSLSDWFW